MIETLANGYSSKSTQRELSNEYQHNRVKMVFKKSLRPCALDKSSFSIGRVKKKINYSSSVKLDHGPASYHSKFTYDDWLSLSHNTEAIWLNHYPLHFV